MVLTLKKPSYPHLTSNKSIAHGAPLIRGTRITVRSIAGYYQLGMTPDEILTALPHLTASQVHSALAYYFDHQVDIDRDLEKTADTDYWKKRALQHPGRKK